MAETLHTCPTCKRGGFTARGLKAHVCKPVKAPAPVAFRPVKLALSAPKRKSKKQVIRVKVADLHIHPALEGRPTMSSVVEELRKLAATTRGSTAVDARARLAEREPEWRAFLSDVALRGVRDPVVIEKRKEGGWWVKDGRNRTAAARENKLADVPALVSDEAPERVILGSLAARRHVSKELLAFVALDCYPQMIREGVGRPSKIDTQCPFSTLEELSEHIGTHINTLKEAARVHRMFKADPSLRLKWEWRLYAGTGFQGILAGNAAEAQGPGNGTTTAKASEQLRKYFQSLSSRVTKQWANLASESLEDRAALVADLRLCIAQMPGDALTIISNAIAQQDEILADHLEAHAEPETQKKTSKPTPKKKTK